MYAQETIQVARSSLVDEPTTVSVLPDIVSVGALQGSTFPVVGGYSIAYLKPGAQRGLVTRDDTAAPLLAFWQAGLGRSAAFLGQADGKLSGDLAGWNGYADFFGTLVRWIAGTEAVGDVYAEVSRQGHEAVLGVEVEAGREDLLGGLEAQLLAPDGSTRRVLLTRVGDTRLEARIPLPREGAYRPVLRTADGRFLRLPAVTLPYSPEFEPRLGPDEGERILRDLVRTAVGRMDPPADELMAGSRRSTGVTPLGPLFAWAALALLLLEILVRRLRPRLPGVDILRPLRWLGALWRSLRARGRAAPEAWEATPERSASTAGDEPEPTPLGKTKAAAQADDEGIASVLDKAKRRRRRR